MHLKSSITLIISHHSHLIVKNTFLNSIFSFIPIIIILLLLHWYFCYWCDACRIFFFSIIKINIKIQCLLYCLIEFLYQINEKYKYFHKLRLYTFQLTQYTLPYFTSIPNSSRKSIKDDFLPFFVLCSDRESLSRVNPRNCIFFWKRVTFFYIWSWFVISSQYVTKFNLATQKKVKKKSKI